MWRQILDVDDKDDFAVLVLMAARKEAVVVIPKLDASL